MRDVVCGYVGGALSLALDCPVYLPLPVSDSVICRYHYFVILHAPYAVPILNIYPSIHLSTLLPLYHLPIDPSTIVHRPSTIDLLPIYPSTLLPFTHLPLSSSTSLLPSPVASRQPAVSNEIVNMDP